MKKLVLLSVLLLSPYSLLAAQTHYKASPAAYQMIKRFEGFYPYTYLDAGGLPTIGFGHLEVKTDHIIEPLLGEKADRLLVSDVNNKLIYLNKGLIRSKLTDNNFSALLDFSFNLGITNFAHSTLRKKINQNASNDEITQEFLRWNKIGNKPFKGLTKRRMAEARLYAQ